MSRIPSQKALEAAHDWQSLGADDRNRIANLIKLLANGDIRANEIITMHSNGEISTEEADILIDEYLAAKH